jgi:hypothetical protein
MGKRRFRSSGGLLLASAVTVGLAACGSSAPKVSSSDFITKCTTNKEITTALKQIPGGTAKLDSLCHCVQNKLVSQGFGNRTTDDNSTALKNAGRNAGVACAQQVLSGGA